MSEKYKKIYLPLDAAKKLHNLKTFELDTYVKVIVNLAEEEKQRKEKAEEVAFFQKDMAEAEK